MILLTTLNVVQVNQGQFSTTKLVVMIYTSVFYCILVYTDWIEIIIIIMCVPFSLFLEKAKTTILSSLNYLQDKIRVEYLPGGLEGSSYEGFKSHMKYW